MLVHSNATINISRSPETDGTTWAKVIIKNDYAVYINIRSENVVDVDSGQWAYKEYMLMTDGIFEILEGDNVIWWARTFRVQWGATYSDLTGTHGQYVIMEVYD